MKLKKISYRVRISELDALTDSFVDYWREANLLQGDEVLSAAFAELEGLSAKITEATRQGRTASNLGDADAARDEALQDLSDILKGYSKVPLPEIRKAGQTLRAVFDKFGLQILGLPYLEESALIVKMLLDFETQGQSVKILPGVAEQIAILDGAQKNFDASRKAYDAAQAEEGKRPSASSFQKPILTLLNERLLPYLSTLSDIKADYADFAALLEQEIERVNRAVAARKKPMAKGEPQEVE